MAQRVELVTRSEYARRRGVSEAAVRRAIAAERISLIDGKIDPAVADQQWERNTRARARTVNTPGSTRPGRVDTSRAPDAGSYADARTRREEAEAGLAEAELQELRRSLVRREDVERGLFEVGRSFRDRLTNCASRLAAEVASLNTAEECYEVIAREHREALELMVKDSREKLGPPPEPEQAE